MRRRSLASLVLVFVGALAACQSTVLPGASSVAPTPPAPSSSGSPSAAPTSSDGGAIDPGWVTRPALTCGDPQRLFPPEALAGPGLAELGLDPATSVLRSVIAEAPPETPFPASGWHRVVDNPEGVTFVAAGDAETPWVMVTVGPQGGTLQATEYGQCILGIAAPDGVSLATWWLDPDGPPITPEATELAILLRERNCASGKPPEGRVLAPTIVTTADSFEVVIGIRRQLTGQDCQGNPAYPMQLVLPEPIGSRGLLDASEFPPRRVTTEEPS